VNIEPHHLISVRQCKQQKAAARNHRIGNSGAAFVKCRQKATGSCT